QIIKVFDLHNHQPVSVEGLARYDGRWTKIKRPLVIVGGEMTIDTMDLIYSQTVRFYEAPFQMKANGGTLVIDDFGRQRIDPHELLNRWIVPLEGRVDYLTLHTGKKIEVPFEQLLIFATNLDPADLVDDAFLRRMGYRLFVTAPSKDLYAQILRRYVEESGFTYDSNISTFSSGFTPKRNAHCGVVNLEISSNAAWTSASTRTDRKSYPLNCSNWPGTITLGRD